VAKKNFKTFKAELDETLFEKLEQRRKPDESNPRFLIRLLDTLDTYEAAEKDNNADISEILELMNKINTNTITIDKNLLNVSNEIKGAMIFSTAELMGLKQYLVTMCQVLGLEADDMKFADKMSKVKAGNTTNFTQSVATAGMDNVTRYLKERGEKAQPFVDKYNNKKGASGIMVGTPYLVFLNEIG